MSRIALNKSQFDVLTLGQSETKATETTTILSPDGHIKAIRIIIPPKDFGPIPASYVTFLPLIGKSFPSPHTPASDSKINAKNALKVQGRLSSRITPRSFVFLPMTLYVERHRLRLLVELSAREQFQKGRATRVRQQKPRFAIGFSTLSPTLSPMLSPPLYLRPEVYNHSYELEKSNKPMFSKILVFDRRSRSVKIADR
jgi:hypothetical protein